MISVFTDTDKFNYDIHSLVKAFFPEEEVKVFTVGGSERTALDLRRDNKIEIFITHGEKSYIENEFRIEIKSVDGDVISGSARYTEEAPAARTNLSTDGTAALLSTPKNTLKQLLYRLLVKKTGRRLPWGSLTGIRPAKIAYGMLEQGANDIKIKNYLKNVYSVSDKKIDLSLEIAKNERKVLSAKPYSEGYSLYIGIPFCLTRCAYCSFAAVPLGSFKERVPLYLEALKKELKATSEFMDGVRLDTLYIGGGTPTTLTPAQMDTLISYIRDIFDTSAVEEFTVEAGRPDSILDDKNKLKVLREHGVNRICVNPQTFVQRTLDAIGRGHSVKQTEEAYYLARSYGFTNINMDIIIGLPGEGAREVEITARKLEELRPDDLTVHSLALKRGSFFQARLAEKTEQEKRTGMRDGFDDMRMGESFVTQKALTTGRQDSEKEPIIRRQDSEKELIIRQQDSGKEPTAEQQDFGKEIFDMPTAADKQLSEISLMMDIAQGCAKNLGLSPYYLYRQKNMTGNMENTGYAREGAFGLTNILGMEEIHSILAVGAGAITKRVYNASRDGAKAGLITRCANVREIDQYISRIDEMILRKKRLFEA